jgi:branched-chain amino acid transport system permease protein
LIEPPVSRNGYTFGETTIPFSPLNTLIILTVVSVLIVISLIFRKTNLGLALRASAYAPEIARLAGVRTAQTRTIGWAIAGGIGGIAGMLVSAENYLSPYSLDLLLVFGFIAAVIGGLESMIGAVVGALVLGVLLSLVMNVLGTSATFTSAFLILILILLIKPEGIIARRKGRRA